MESAQCPPQKRQVVPVRSTFVHFDSFNDEILAQKGKPRRGAVPRRRGSEAEAAKPRGGGNCSSCPTLPAAAAVWGQRRPRTQQGAAEPWPPELPKHGATSGKYKRPQKATREALQDASVEELVEYAHVGLEKLANADDRIRAKSLLPPSIKRNRAELPRVSTSFIATINWTQLMNLVKDYAVRKAKEDQKDDGGAQYLIQVCDKLLSLELRDEGVVVENTDISLPNGTAASCEEDSVHAWRAGTVAWSLGLGPLWEEVSWRQKRGVLVILRSGHVARLSEEVATIQRLVRIQDGIVRGIEVMDILESFDSLQRVVRGCDVLYVTGLQTTATAEVIRQLHAPSATLAILNVCCSAKLAKRLLLRGPRHAMGWPARVRDDAAASFGIRFLKGLFDASIAASFRQALNELKELTPSERAPELFSSNCGRELVSTITVVLEQRGSRPSGRKAFVGRSAEVLSYTASNGWVHVRVDEDILPWRRNHWRLLRKKSIQEAVRDEDTQTTDPDVCQDTMLDPEDDTSSTSSTSKREVGKRLAAETQVDSTDDELNLETLLDSTDTSDQSDLEYRWHDGVKRRKKQAKADNWPSLRRSNAMAGSVTQIMESPQKEKVQPS